MLLCGIQDVQPGSVLGATVMDPRKPGHDLLRPGVELDARLLASLRKRGVLQVWVESDLARDLDAAVAPELAAARLELYSKLRDGLADCARGKLVVAAMQTYRQAVLGLVTEAISSARYASLADTLFSSDGQASHGSNVAYLALLTGLHLERYIIAEQSRLDREHARDLAVLGLAGMLHDIGKSRLGPKAASLHECHFEPRCKPPEEYAEHVAIGKVLLEHSRVPARVANAVLNHHQRFDGSGWPDMTRHTAGRLVGPLEGRRIHIFARIVSAANVLDNLLRDGEGANRPPVAALWLFASERYDGWFDPLVRRAVLLRIPPFAIGTQVRLSDGRAAVVVAPTPEDPCRPLVRILGGKAGGEAEMCDLRAVPGLSITHALGVEVGRYLYEAPPIPPAACAPAADAGSQDVRAAA
jgi:HD-GYP domain-containing protein (c-di-GMP phosphodiesterase class II)